jgi:hypothetical protein
VDNQLKAVWDSINYHIDESRILSMLAKENLSSEIDYGRYLEYGYSQDDVSIGFELIRIYKTLQMYIKDIKQDACLK